MTTPTIDNAFITQFGADVQEAYQRQGSKLRGFVRHRSFQPGEKTRFQAIGSGVATTKTRHGDITPMNLQHRYIDVTMADYYAGEYVDKLDLLRTNIDERMLIANAEAYAHGRKTDEVIFTALHASYTSTINTATGARKYSSSTAQTFTAGLVHLINEDFNGGDVPDDGGRTWVVGVKTWTKLMGVEEFVNADYVGFDQLSYKGGLTVKDWNGWRWVTHSGMPVDGSSDERTIAFHKSAVGHAVLQEVSTDVTWQGTKQAWFIASAMSQGAGVVDATGALEVVIDV